MTLSPKQFVITYMLANVCFYPYRNRPQSSSIKTKAINGKFVTYAFRPGSLKLAMWLLDSNRLATHAMQKSVLQCKL